MTGRSKQSTAHDGSTIAPLHVMLSNTPPGLTDVVPTGQATQLGFGLVALPPWLYAPTGHTVQPPPDVGVRPLPAAQTVTAVRHPGMAVHCDDMTTMSGRCVCYAGGVGTDAARACKPENGVGRPCSGGGACTCTYMYTAHARAACARAVRRRARSPNGRQATNRLCLHAGHCRNELAYGCHISRWIHKLEQELDSQ